LRKPLYYDYDISRSSYETLSTYGIHAQFMAHLCKRANQQKIISPRVIALTLFFVVVIPCLPLLISWRWDWWEAWVYALVSLLGFALSRALAARRHPDLLAERARFMQHEDTKHWDKRLAPLLGLGGGLVLLVAGLDALFHWSPPFSLPVKIFSLVVMLAGYVLGSYALIENRVELQGYSTCSTGDEGRLQALTPPPNRGVIHHILGDMFGDRLRDGTIHASDVRGVAAL
jgi:hypothetical protein